MFITYHLLGSHLPCGRLCCSFWRVMQRCNLGKGSVCMPHAIHCNGLPATHPHVERLCVLRCLQAERSSLLGPQSACGAIKGDGMSDNPGHQPHVSAADLQRSPWPFQTCCHMGRGVQVSAPLVPRAASAAYSALAVRAGLSRGVFATTGGLA